MFVRRRHDVFESLHICGAARVPRSYLGAVPRHVAAPLLNF
jgi:hypothetical protein